MRIILTVMLIVLFWYVPILNLDILCSPNSLVNISKDCTSCVHRKLMEKQLWRIFSIEIKSIFSSELHQFYHCLVLARIFVVIGNETICFLIKNEFFKIFIHDWMKVREREYIRVHFYLFWSWSGQARSEQGTTGCNYWRYCCPCRDSIILLSIGH